MESQIKRLFLMFLTGLCLFSPPAQADDYPSSIRVAVLKDARDFTLKVRGHYLIMDDKTQKILKEGRSLQESLVYVSKKGLVIGMDIYDVNRLRVTTDKDVSIIVDNNERRYRGMMDIVADKGTLTVINVLDLEEYTKGVLYHEVSHRWPIEAIKAQAVATRTYAVYQAIQNKRQLFDVKNDIYSQVYGGKTAERYRTNIAANRTTGQILTYRGKVLPAYFHATCGGATEDVRELWKYNDLPPLHGVKCDYCVLAPYYRWSKDFRSQNLQDLLNKNGYNLDLIDTIRISERTDSGRAKTLEIKTKTGKRATISGKKFREFLGPNDLKSNFFEIEMKGYYFNVLGKGWGHGVGMCQWGAYYMSRDHFKYREILSYYYPGAQIEEP